MARCPSAALVLLAVAAGCGGKPVGPTEPRAGEAVVDLRNGTYRGVGLGDTAAEIRRRFGPARCVADESSVPLGEDYYDVGGPVGVQYFDRPDREPQTYRRRPVCALRYRRVSFLMSSPGGVHGFIVTDPRAVTARGVGIGDSAGTIRRRYPRARCSGGAEDAAASCQAVGRPLRSEADTGSPRELHFGMEERWLLDDRVLSIQLYATSPRGFAR